jgi:hypothetical protein
MKRKVQARQSPLKSAKPVTFDIAVQDPKILELEKLINQRKRITRKIEDLPKLEQRLKIENPGFTLEQLFVRLEEKKIALDKAIAKHDGLSKQKNPGPHIPRVGQIAVLKERAPMTFQEIVERMQALAHTNLGKFLPRTCPTVNGRTTPYLTRIGTTIPDLNDLNHNSSANYIVDQQSYSMGELNYLIGAWLNDDASIWRFDDPDSVMWYDNICLYLPTLECDSIVVASLSMRFSGEIFSEAGDHNEIRQYVYIAHSDEDGNLPPYVSFGEKYSLNNIDLSGEIGLPGGNRFDSDWVRADMSFTAKSNVTPQVAVANCTELFAQDGTLEIIGTWRITDLVYFITPI